MVLPMQGPTWPNAAATAEQWLEAVREIMRRAVSQPGPVRDLRDVGGAIVGAPGALPGLGAGIGALGRTPAFEPVIPTDPRAPTTPLESATRAVQETPARMANNALALSGLAGLGRWATTPYAPIGGAQNPQEPPYPAGFEAGGPPPAALGGAGAMGGAPAGAAFGAGNPRVDDIAGAYGGAPAAPLGAVNPRADAVGGLPPGAGADIAPLSGASPLAGGGPPGGIGPPNPAWQGAGGPGAGGWMLNEQTGLAGYQNPRLALAAAFRQSGVDPNANIWARQAIEKYGPLMQDLADIWAASSGTGALGEDDMAAVFPQFLQHFMQGGSARDILLTALQKAEQDPTGQMAMYIDQMGPEKLFRLAGALSGESQGMAGARQEMYRRQLEAQRISQMQNPTLPTDATAWLPQLRRSIGV
jgi:hypothetical protein